MNAKGPFEVKLVPQPMSEAAQPAHLQRLSLDKVFHGALDGTSLGEMLAVRTPDGHSGGYVALERFTGTLDGKRGTFCLQHSSTMHEGTQSQSIQVVPGSGTDELAGVHGNMEVHIEHGMHVYDFHYSYAISSPA
ncbi:MAG: DUF3224 domain-containing protein [Polyangia bacterium]